MYGLDPKIYLAMREKQGDLCAICRQPEKSKGIFNLSIDHNHKTGQVRGLLCKRCNTGIAMFGDDPTFLDRAKEYLCTTSA